MERVNITIGSLTSTTPTTTLRTTCCICMSASRGGEGEETPEGHVVRYAPGTSRVVGLTVLGARRVLERDGLFGHRPRDVETTPTIWHQRWRRSEGLGSRRLYDTERDRAGSGRRRSNPASR